MHAKVSCYYIIIINQCPYYLPSQDVTDVEFGLDLWVGRGWIWQAYVRAQACNNFNNTIHNVP